MGTALGMKKVKDRIENGGRSENNLCSIQDYIDFLYKMWKFFLFIKVREVWVSFFLVCKKKSCNTYGRDTENNENTYSAKISDLKFV